MTSQFPTDKSALTHPLHLRRSARLALWLLYVLPTAFYAAIVLFAPLDVFDLCPSSKKLADQIHAWLLSKALVLDIYRHARSTEFPQVAMLSSAMGVAIALSIAIAVCVWSLIIFKHTAPLLSRSSKRRGHRFGELFALPALGIFCLWGFYCVPGDWSFAQGATTKSRLGYLFYSTVAILMAAVGVGTWIVQVRVLIKDIFYRRSHE